MNYKKEYLRLRGVIAKGKFRKRLYDETKQLFCIGCYELKDPEDFSRNKNRSLNKTCKCKKCNSIHDRSRTLKLNPKARENQPSAEREQLFLEGLRKCTTCLLKLPISEFSIKKLRSDGLKHACKTCDHIRDHLNEKYIYWDNLCIETQCSDRDCVYPYLMLPSQLHFHHLPGYDKIAGIAQMLRYKKYSLDGDIKPEQKKGKILCGNCHTLSHHKPQVLKGILGLLQCLKLTKGCFLCGLKTRIPRQLEYHHLYDKDFSLGNGLKKIGIGGKPYQTIYKEVKKCVVLCVNCHAITRFPQRLLQDEQHRLSYIIPEEVPYLDFLLRLKEFADKSSRGLQKEYYDDFQSILTYKPYITDIQDIYQKTVNF